MLVAGFLLSLELARLSVSPVPPTARAQDARWQKPIATDRPDFTETTDTVPLGMLQLEGGYTLTRLGRARDHSVGELLLRVATGRRTELRVGLNSYAWSHGMGTAHGVEDLSLGMKVRLAESSERFRLERPAASLILETSLPTGASCWRSHDPQPAVKLLLGWDLSEQWSMGSNINYTYASDQGDRFHQLSASLTFGRSFSDRFGMYLEGFGFSPNSADGPDAHFVNVGATYLVSPDFQLDVRVGKGLSGTRPDDFIGIGAARRW